MKPAPANKNQIPHSNGDNRIVVRQADRSDLEMLWGIEQTCFAEDAFTRPQIAYLALKARGACFVALREGTLAGYIMLLVRANTQNIRIYSVAVASEFRGCGVAKRLIEETLRFARESHRTCITLEVRSDNASALALYEGLGFQRTALLKGYYHGGADGWRMTLKIKDPDR